MYTSNEISKISQQIWFGHHFLMLRRTFQRSWPLIPRPPYGGVNTLVDLCFAKSCYRTHITHLELQ